MQQIKSSKDKIEQEYKAKVENLKAAEKAIQQKYSRQVTVLELSEKHVELIDDDSHSQIISLSKDEPEKEVEEHENASENVDVEGTDEEEDVEGAEKEWSEGEVRLLVNLYDSNIPLDKMIATLKRRFGTTRTMVQCNAKYEKKAAEIWRGRVS